MLSDAARLALAYAPAATRPRLRAVLAVDETLQRVTANGREPVLTQVRLAWWRERCDDLEPGGGGGHPVLGDLIAHWKGDTAPLVRLIDGWEEALVGKTNTRGRVDRLAAHRGQLIATAVGVSGPLAPQAANAWTALSLAKMAAAPTEAEDLLALARAAAPAALPRALRPVALLDGLARRAARRGEVALLGDRWSPLAALRLGILGR